MYHDIRKKTEDFFPKRYALQSFITPEKFKQTLDVIKSSNKRFLPSNADLQVESLKNQNFNVLTFDDGLVDHLEVARNLYAKRIKAIFFIPYAPVFDSIMINSHKIQFILASSNIQNLVEELKFFYFDNYDWINKNELDHFYLSRWKNNIWPPEMIFFTRVLREAANKDWREKALNFLFSCHVTKDEKAFACDFYLSPEQVAEISNLGHLIGGHGNFSLDLRFEDSKIIENEIAVSSKFLSNYSADNFCYAYANGGVNAVALDMLRKNGFGLGLCTDNLDLSFEHELTSENYLINRIDATKLL